MRAFQMSGLLLLSLAIGFAEAQKPASDGKAQNSLNAQDRALVQQAGEISGRLTRLNPTARSFTLYVVYPKLQPGAAPNPKAGRRPVVRMESRNIPFVFSDDVNVRLLKPAVQFDEKGKPIPFTPEQRKDLKGPDPSF